jgi:hypothetical protein
MSIKISVLSLCKSNNGFFKSEKQANFLISQLELKDGYFGQNDSGFNTCPLFAAWDNKGILRVKKSTIKGMVITFERKVKGITSELELKEIKRLKRKLKKEEKRLNERINSFYSGEYNSTGDIKTYTENLIINYCFYANQERDIIINLKNKLNASKIADVGA